MGFLSRLFGKKEENPAPSSPPPTPPAKEESTPDWQLAGGVPQELAASEALEMLQSAEPPAFLDVRDPHELEADGVIPGSTHIPMHEIQGRMDELDPKRPVIVYCSAGMRSMEVGAFLLEQGFMDVSNLNGGLQNWKGPLEKVG